MKPQGKAQGRRIERWLKEGAGRGPNYEPWLRVHQVKSAGLSSRVFSRAAGRVVHLMSNAERSVYYYLDYHPSVLDIREQYPLLPPWKTRGIAKKLGITHPRAPRGEKEPWVMTTDFRVTVATAEGPRDWLVAAKPRREVSPRALRILAIERRFWAEEGRPWDLLVASDFPRTLRLNLAWLHPFVPCPGTDPGGFRDPEREQAALAHLSRARASLAGGCLELDEHMGLPDGATLAFARRQLAERKWEGDLTRSELPHGPLGDLRRGGGFLAADAKETRWPPF